MRKGSNASLILERIEQISGQKFGLDDKLTLDSIEFYELIFDLEDEFNIEFDEKKIPDLETPRQILEYLS